MENYEKEENFDNFDVTSHTPGKVLLCGGYIIIDPKYSGLVLTTDTYFDCKSSLTFSKSKQNMSFSFSLFTKYVNLKVFSDYYKISYNYIIEIKFQDESEEIFLDIKNQGEDYANKFIEYSILCSFYFFILSHYSDFEKVNSFFTFLEKSLDTINIDLKSDIRFYTCHKKLESLNQNIKTGLGSSSALICSINSNLFYMLETLFKSHQELKIERRLKISAQEINPLVFLSSIFSNNMAQNKIGSGFDIQSCLIGSHIFNKLLIEENASGILTSQTGNQELSPISSETYNQLNELLEKYSQLLKSIKRVSLPKSLQSCLISLECGSDTRILVSKVIKWAERNKTKEIFDDEIFQKINKQNLEIIRIFQTINEMESSQLNSFIKEDFLQQLKLSGLDIELKEKCIELRKYIKLLTELSETEVEPQILSKLNDKLLGEEEILFAICPGAGGYDGIFVIGYGEFFQKKVETKLSEFNEENEKNFKAFYLDLLIESKGTSIYIQ